MIPNEEKCNRAKAIAAAQEVLLFVFWLSSCCSLGAAFFEPFYGSNPELARFFLVGSGFVCAACMGMYVDHLYTGVMFAVCYICLFLAGSYASGFVAFTAAIACCVIIGISNLGMAVFISIFTACAFIGAFYFTTGSFGLIFFAVLAATGVALGFFLPRVFYWKRKVKELCRLHSSQGPYTAHRLIVFALAEKLRKKL